MRSTHTEARARGAFGDEADSQYGWMPSLLLKQVLRENCETEMHDEFGEAESARAITIKRGSTYSY